METNHKGSKGFIRDKLAKAKSFLRVNSTIKPSSTPLQCSFNKVSPSPYSPPGSMASSNGQSHSNSSSIQRVTASAQPTSNSYGFMEFPPIISQYSTQKISDAHYKRSSFHEYGGDENVDVKIASYISYARERFMLEKIDSEA